MKLAQPLRVTPVYSRRDERKKTRGMGREKRPAVLPRNGPGGVPVDVRKEKRQENEKEQEPAGEREKGGVVGERLSLRKNEVFTSSRGNREVITFFRETVMFRRKKKIEGESCTLSSLSPSEISARD